MRELNVKTRCELPAARFWALRSDVGFDEYFTSCEGQGYTLIKNDLQDGKISREYKLSVQENPIPPALRGILPKLDEFFFRVVCSFHTELYDRAHPYTYQTFFPVMTDRICVTGKQYCEPLGPNACNLVSCVQIEVKFPPPMSWTAERSMEVQIKDAYAQLATRAKVYADRQVLAATKASGASAAVPRPLRGGAAGGGGGAAAAARPPAPTMDVHWDYSERSLLTSPPKPPGARLPGAAHTPLASSKQPLRKSPPLETGVTGALWDGPVGTAGSSTHIPPLSSSASGGGIPANGGGGGPAVFGQAGDLPEAIARCLVPSVSSMLDNGARAVASEARLANEVSQLRLRVARAEAELATSKGEVGMLTEQVSNRIGCRSCVCVSLPALPPLLLACLPHLLCCTGCSLLTPRRRSHLPPRQLKAMILQLKKETESGIMLRQLPWAAMDSSPAAGTAPPAASALASWASGAASPAVTGAAPQPPLAAAAGSASAAATEAAVAAAVEAATRGHDDALEALRSELRQRDAALRQRDARIKSLTRMLAGRITTGSKSPAAPAETAVAAAESAAAADLKETASEMLLEAQTRLAVLRQASLIDVPSPPGEHALWASPPHAGKQPAKLAPKAERSAVAAPRRLYDLSPGYIAE